MIVSSKIHLSEYQPVVLTSCYFPFGVGYYPVFLRTFLPKDAETAFAKALVSQLMIMGEPLTGHPLGADKIVPNEA